MGHRGAHLTEFEALLAVDWTVSLAGGALAVDGADLVLPLPPLKTVETLLPRASQTWTYVLAASASYPRRSTDIEEIYAVYD